jgi:hypothetical protein
VLAILDPPPLRGAPGSGVGQGIAHSADDARPLFGMEVVPDSQPPTRTFGAQAAISAETLA